MWTKKLPLSVRMHPLVLPLLVHRLPMRCPLMPFSRRLNKSLLLLLLPQVARRKRLTRIGMKRVNVNVIAMVVGRVGMVRPFTLGRDNALTLIIKMNNGLRDST